MSSGGDGWKSKTGVTPGRGLGAGDGSGKNTREEQRKWEGILAQLLSLQPGSPDVRMGLMGRDVYPPCIFADSTDALFVSYI